MSSLVGIAMLPSKVRQPSVMKYNDTTVGDNFANKEVQTGYWHKNQTSTFDAWPFKVPGHRNFTFRTIKFIIGSVYLVMRRKF